MRLRIKKINFRKLLAFLVIIVAIVGGFGSWYFYNKYQTLKANPNVEAQAEVKSLTTTIGKFMELPTDEDPTVATILDKEKIKDQPFFKNAKNGDKLLAYTKAMKAILYRPSTNRIIEVGPIINNQQPAAEEKTTTNDSTIQQTQDSVYSSDNSPANSPETPTDSQ